MRYVRELITPAKAAEYLKLNLNNRRMSSWRVAQYERQLKAGLWHETHQGVAFTDTGVLADGQTRLQAIVNAGVPAVMWVATGMSSEALLVLDQQRPRSVSDNLIMAGIDTSREHVSTLRVIEFGESAFQARANSISTDEAKNLLERHAEALAFAFETFPKKKSRGTPSYIRGLLGRASYSADHAALREFATVLLTGDSAVTERPAVRALIFLRDLLLAAPNETREGRRGMYLKANRALRAFVDGEPLSKLYAASRDLFDLPVTVTTGDAELQERRAPQAGA